MLRVSAIKLADGFDSCALRENGQHGLSLDQSSEAVSEQQLQNANICKDY